MEKVPAGEAGLLLEIEGFAPMRIDAAVAPGAATDLGEILLDPGHAVEGRVVDRSGRPAAKEADLPEEGTAEVEFRAPGAETPR